MSRENPQGTILPLRTMISEIQIKIMCLDYTQSKKLKAEMGRGRGREPLPGHVTEHQESDRSRWKLNLNFRLD